MERVPSYGDKSPPAPSVMPLRPAEVLAMHKGNLQGIVKERERKMMSTIYGFKVYQLTFISKLLKGKIPPRILKRCFSHGVNLLHKACDSR